MHPIPKGPDDQRPPTNRRRFTVRNAAGISLAHGATPQEAAKHAAGRGIIAFIEERDKAYPFTVWHRARVG